MNDILDTELTGPQTTVLIRGTQRPLAYPLHAVILYKQKTGDSLFVSENFKKIDLQTDPERWLACLWAGLHQFSDGKWTAPFSLEELESLVDFSNSVEISVSMVKALTQSMPKAAEDADPKEAAPGEPEQPPKSTGSTTGPSEDLVSAAQNS
jgi:hypothetical protein